MFRFLYNTRNAAIGVQRYDAKILRRVVMRDKERKRIVQARAKRVRIVEVVTIEK